VARGNQPSKGKGEQAKAWQRGTSQGMAMGNQPSYGKRELANLWQQGTSQLVARETIQGTEKKVTDIAGALLFRFKMSGDIMMNYACYY
jgi:hypothetical protein